jgi:putative hydrolase of the HAD superfamily
MTQDKLDFVLAKQLPDEVKRAAADFVVETGPTAMGFDSFAPARASLAKMLMSLADRHAAVYEMWRDTPSHSSALQSPPSFAAPVKGVSFDLDDTLWPTMPPLAAATISLQAAIQHHMPAAYAAGAADTSALRTQVKAVIDAAPDLAHDFTELRRAALLALASAHGHAPQCAATALDAFVRTRSDVAAHFYADARPALLALRAAGLRVGACTNGNCDVTLHEEVAQYFDFSVTAAAAGCSKPAPVPFWFAANGAHCRPCELVHIGDDEDTDLKGALAAGCRAILLTRPGTSSHARANAAAGGDKPQANPARWREVASLDEAVAVVLEWQRCASCLR